MDEEQYTRLHTLYELARHLSIGERAEFLELIEHAEGAGGDLRSVLDELLPFATGGAGARDALSDARIRLRRSKGESLLDELGGD